METLTKTPALDDLARFLRLYHSHYSIHNLAPSATPGYLHALVACPRAGTYWLCGPREHYHTIQIGHWPHGFGKGHGQGAYAWWRAVVAEYAELGIPVHANASPFEKPSPSV
jgi:hypothetical protein